MKGRVGLALLAVAGLVFGAVQLRASASTPCFTGGYGVQAVYVGSNLAGAAPQIQEQITVMDTAMWDSSNGERAIRWVTDESCVPIIAEATTTNPDSIQTVITELGQQGYNLPNRRYLVFAEPSVYCGISQLGSPTYPNGSLVGIVGSGCWAGERSTALHELMHMLGAVQPTAPHADGSGHCTDDADLMCYAYTTPCPPEQERLLDCNDDDYFDVTGTLDPALNTANSLYLYPNAAPSPSPSASVSPSPTVSPTPSPVPSPSPSCRPRGNSGKCK